MFKVEPTRRIMPGTLTWGELMYRASIEARDRARCHKMLFGAVLWVPQGKGVIYDGYNGPLDRDICGKCLRASVLSGTRLEQCRALHAEQRALLDCYQWGSSPVGGVMAVAGMFPDKEDYYRSEPGFYCTVCARLLYAAGVREIAVRTKDGIWVMDMEEALESAYETVAQGGHRETMYGSTAGVPESAGVVRHGD